ncbi:hypothetical protein MASR2M78_24710 [Treponema sp.]
MRRVLIVDDEGLVRLSVRALEDWPALGFDLAYEACDGQEALAIITAHKDIELILADVDMPVMNGLELAEKLREQQSPIRILFLSSFDSFDFARRAFKAGAEDYILKSEMDEGRLLAALQKIADIEGSSPGMEKTRSERVDLFFNRLLSSAARETEQEIIKEEDEIQLRLQLPLSGILLRPSDPRLVAERFSTDTASFSRLVSDLIRQNLLSYTSGEVATISFERYLVLLNESENPDTFFEEFLRSAWNYLDLDFEAKKLKPVSTWASLQESHAEAEGRFCVSSRLVVRARRYVRDHYAEADLDLSAIAAYAEVSKNHLSWEFTRETGENLSSHIARVRVEAAKKLLSDSNLKTYEIAEQVGFSNVETFCRVFKKTTGMTPRGYNP